MKPVRMMPPTREKDLRTPPASWSWKRVQCDHEVWVGEVWVGERGWLIRLL